VASDRLGVGRSACRPSRREPGVTAVTPSGDPEQLLDGLDPDQREAVRITRGPLVIHAGAGSGKTRVISHRVAYAVARGDANPHTVLVVTFTEKAAGEMAERLAALGLAGIATRTFHAAALAQLRYFWPSRNQGAASPELLESKVPILARLARGLPGGYRFTPTKDLADEIEWAKSRRLTPATYVATVAGEGREAPIPADLFAGIWTGYERTKDRAGRLDFDDILLRTVELLETDAGAAAQVRDRYRWFSVDEYQDTSPLQERLLELWLGPGDDLCVVGDEDQTIYTFTGATPRFLQTFAERHPGTRQVTLTRNYRSSPEVLALANRLVAADGREKRLVAVRPSGPTPRIVACGDDGTELDQVVTSIRSWLAEGTPAGEIAVLVRINAQLQPVEDALSRAGIPFQLRGQGFFGRRDVREAIRILRRLPEPASGGDLAGALAQALTERLGYEAENGHPAGGADRGGAEARERDAALARLLSLVEGLRVDLPEAGPAELAADLDERAAIEASGVKDGVNLLTLHRAKGLEWDAVILPSVEEGLLPIRQADSPESVAEERRLFYVGLTRARRHLLVSWARQRSGPSGRENRRRPSRFLADLGSVPGSPGGPPRRVIDLGGPGGPGGPGAVRRAGAVRADRPASSVDPATFEALRAWRTEAARAAGVPAYVVAHDSLLEALADRRPDSIPALRRVPGMGPTRLERYGEAILAVLRSAPPQRRLP
jgi:DNA helicase-2/ATP-dependent DNA helicase PcrA